jgi:hypothetical protein
MNQLGTRVGDPTKYIPRFDFLLEWPEDISERRHNAFAKAALRYALEKYHSSPTGFPRHFGRSGRRLYDYMPRQEKYAKWKQQKYGTGGMDMVKTGRTRRWMTSAYRLTVGGTAGAQTLNAVLKLTFPFRGGSGRFRKRITKKGVNIQRMILEMQRFAADEPPQIVAWFNEEYWRLVNEFRSTRKRKRIRS